MRDGDDHTACPSIKPIDSGARQYDITPDKLSVYAFLWRASQLKVHLSKVGPAAGEPDPGRHQRLARGMRVTVGVPEPGL